MLLNTKMKWICLGKSAVEHSQVMLKGDDTVLRLLPTTSRLVSYSR